MCIEKVFDMNFNYKNFDGINNDIIEIVSSDSALGLLKKCDNENIKVCLPLTLSIGKLNSLTPFNRKILSQIYKNKSYDFTKDFNKLNKVSNNSKRIRVWTSHLDCDEYCLLLLICYLYRDKEISTIFSEEINHNAFAIGFISEKEIKEFKNKEHILTDLEKENYSNEWENLVNYNKELRYMFNGKIVSCDFEDLSKKITQRLKDTGKIPMLKFIANLMGNPIIPNVIYSDSIYIFLIKKLEKKGIIKSWIINGIKYIELN